MHNFGARTPSPAASNGLPNRKRLGGYLVEAGLLTPAQVDVALNDQKLTGMRFGEILAARGWVKQQTIEYLMKKIVLPEQQAKKHTQVREKSLGPDEHDTVTQTVSGSTTTPTLRSGSGISTSSSNSGKAPTTRRDVPISKPLPPVNPSDDGVSWVG